MHDTDQQLDANAQAIDHPPDPAAASSGDDVMALLAGVEQQFERLRTVQATHADEVRTLAERSTELDGRHEELEHRRSALADRQGDLDRAAESLERQRSEMREERAELEGEREQLEEQLRGWNDDREQTARVLNERESELQRWSEELGDHESRLAEAQERMSGLREQLDESVEMTTQLQLELDEARSQLEESIQRSASNEQAAMELLQETELQRDELAGDLEAVRVEREELLGRLEHAVGERDERLGALERELEDANDKLQTAGRKLVEFSQRLSGQVPELERGAAVTLELDEQRRRIEQLTRQLDDAAGDDEAIRRKDEHIQELSMELESLRATLTTEDDDRCRVDEHQADLERRAREEQEELAEAHRVVCEERDQLQQELCERAARPDEGPNDGRDEASSDQADGLHVRLDEAEDRSEQLRRQLAAEREGRDRNALEFQRQHAELTVALKQVREELELARAGAARQVESPELEQYTRHLARRRDRLRRAKALLRDARVRNAERPASDAGDEQAESNVRTEQLHLEEVRKLLVASEKLMVRKWARNRSILAVCAVFILLAVNAGGAWKIAGLLFPPEPVATITLAPDGVPSLPPSERTAWAQWHTALLHDEAVQVAIAERMGDRLLGNFESPAAVRTLIVNELGVDAGRGEGLALTLRSADAEEARTALEVVVGTLIDESRRRAADRGATPALAAPALATAGRSAISILPINDRRLGYAAPIFGGLCVVMLALFGIIYSQCSNTRRVLDEYAELFATSAGTDPEEFEGSLKPLVWE